MVLSRYHWHLITVWTGLLLLYNKAKIAFAPVWHTPIVHCMNYEPFWCYPPKDASLSDKANAHLLNTMFEVYILKLILNSSVWHIFEGQPIPYDDIITQNPVDEKYQFSLDNVIAVVIIGQNSDLPLPSTKDEIIEILKSRHEV